MSLIVIQNLSFGYGANTIFENLNWSFDSRFKIGLIGRNGRGKTTLLKLLQGELSYSGKIVSSLQFSSFPILVKNTHILAFDLIISLLPNVSDWQIYRECNLIGLDLDCLYRKYSTLSGGETTKLGLVVLFLQENKFLLIDEPTDSLDFESRQLVAEYLNSKLGFILVSHDRDFLDNCVDHILSINKMDIDFQSGNFSSWQYNRQLLDNHMLSQNQKLEKDIDRLQDASKQKSDWSLKAEKAKKGAADRGFMGAKAARQMKTAKIIEKRMQSAIAKKQSLLNNIERFDDINIECLVSYSPILLQLKNIAIKYQSREILSNFNIEINQGERICIVGKNGVGKSSLLKVIANDIENIQFEIVGQINRANQLKVSYLSQNMHMLKGSIAQLIQHYNLDLTIFFTILAKFGINKSHFDANIQDMSLGQKKKIGLAKSLCTPANLYIWDEPLNYLDIISRMQIEQFIVNCSPTIVFVEHDKAFCDLVSTKTIQL
ncbi:MAG: ATP-binding cassette domain-containing protein [Firmicutes bacterium]|nr:ATP-binding cassette domain-containing protein [Bacillota bacterium]